MTSCVALSRPKAAPQQRLNISTPVNQAGSMTGSMGAQLAATSCGPCVGGPPTLAQCGVVGGPVPNTSRVGRHRQRYGENGERLVAGCIPVKYVDDGSGQQQLQVCMITTRGGKGLVFPKGGWEDDETVEGAARRETVEEAGVRGELEEPMLGEFRFTSGKASQHIPEPGQPQQASGTCLAYMYVMQVQEELCSWPESNDRQRIWCGLPEAQQQCKHEWMREALAQATQRLASKRGAVPAEPAAPAAAPAPCQAWNS